MANNCCDWVVITCVSNSKWSHTLITVTDKKNDSILCQFIPMKLMLCQNISVFVGEYNSFNFCTFPVFCCCLESYHLFSTHT